MNPEQNVGNDQMFNENQTEEHHLINIENIPHQPTAAHSQISSNKNPESSSFLNLINGSYLLMGLNLVLFGLFLFFRLDKDLEWTFSAIAIPFYFFEICFSICLVKIVSHPILNYRDLGKHLTLFTVIANTILVSIFMFLLMLKLDSFLKCDFTIIFIPLYIGMAISLFYICFIFPGLIDKDLKLYDEAFLLLLYFFGIMVWAIMLNLRLDNFIHWFNFKIFLVLFIVFGTHILISIKGLFETENFLRSLKRFILILLITFSFILIVMKMDDMIEKSWAIICIPMITLIMLVYGMYFEIIFEKFRN